MQIFFSHLGPRDTFLCSYVPNITGKCRRTFSQVGEKERHNEQQQHEQQ